MRLNQDQKAGYVPEWIRWEGRSSVHHSFSRLLAPYLAKPLYLLQTNVHLSAKRAKQESTGIWTQRMPWRR